MKLYDFSASHKRNYDADPVNEFTQLVYDGQTREVGVAFSLSRSNKQYVVARYYKKRNEMMLDSEVHPAHSGKISALSTTDYFRQIIFIYTGNSFQNPYFGNSMDLR